MMITSLLARGASPFFLHRAFHSPSSLIVGDAPHVGVLDLPGTQHHPPLRLFFPANLSSSKDDDSDGIDVATRSTSSKKVKQATYFINNRVSYVLEGMAHIVFARHTTKMYRFLIRPLVWLFSLFFPVRFLRIPNTMQVNNNALDNTDLRVRYLPPSSYALNTTTKQEISADNNQQSQKNQSLVLFSHGLTGTGEENSIFCTSLAKRGYVVACLHHCDGSSSRVPLPDGTCRFYEHLPSGDDYDPKDRMEQVHVRAKELLDTCSWLLGDTTAGESEGMNSDNDTNEKKDDHPIVKQIRSHLNPQKVIASGFSYGATTCSLAATLEPTRFQCAILLDGWFHVDYTSQGVEYDFPPEAFGASWPKKVTSTPDTDNTDTATKSLKNDSNGKDKNDASTKNVDGDTSVSPSNNNIRGLNIPCLFINSSQFQGYKKLNGATHRLADLIKNNLHNSNINNEKRSAPTSEMHVIPNTKHQNFCDVVFWLPRWATRRMGKFIALGTADALEVHESILDLTVGFLKHV